ncbi:MAG: metallopeptidase TldD-related protein, partial [Dehalococcoidales bacterium]|nr:metallopeptidase TldD-related protein [Dehalococcoidales bacterium]
MEDILNQARKVAEEAEVFLISEEETPVQFETNRLKHIQSKQSSSLALRIIKEGKIGYAITTRLSDGQDLINNAIETAQFGTTAQFELPSQTSFPEVAAFDPEVESVPLEKMVTLGEEMITAIRNNSSEIICEAGVTKRVVSVSMINSRGGEASYRKSIFSLGLEGNIIHGTDMLFVGEVESSCHPILETGSVVRAVRQQLDFARRLASVATGPLPVVFTPNGVAGALILPLMAAFNGKTVLEGASPIGSKIGQPVFDTSLWLWDDPTIPYRPGSRPCD